MHALTPEETRYEKYLDVAMSLLMSADEPSPSARALVAQLGGSLTTANKAMRVFWGYVARQLNYRQQYPAGIPEPIVSLTERLMASAREAAAQELTEATQLLEQREQQANELTAGQQATIDGQRLALEALRERFRVCARERDERCAESEQLTEVLQQQKDELANHAQENDRLRQQVSWQSKEQEQARAQIEQLTQERAEHRAEISKLHNRLVAREQKVGALEAQRAEATARSDNHETMLVDARARQQTYRQQQERQNAAQQAVINELRQAVETAEAASLAHERNYQQLAAAHHQLQDAAQSERATHDKLTQNYRHLQIEQSRLEVHRLRLPGMEQQIEDLRAERDRLLVLLANQQNTPAGNANN